MAGIDNFTPKARHVLSLAQKEAERLRKPQISTEHLLIALVDLEGSVASRVLKELGLDSDTVKTVIEKFAGGPVGVSSLAVAIGEERQTLEEVHEPYLIQIGFLKRTQQGRVATPLAYKHFGLEPPASAQGTFI